MTIETIKDALASFEVVMELLQLAENETEMPDGDILKVKNYLIAAKGITDTQITLLQNVLIAEGS